MTAANRKRIGWVGMACLFGVIGSYAGAAEPADPIPIGIVTSFFQDAPQQKAGVLVGPFKALIRAQTGFASDVHFGEGPYGLGQELSDGKVKLAVFQGI